MLTELEKKIIAAIQADMPVCERPYQVLAEKLEMDEADLLKRLRDLTRRGVIRRFGATLRHQKSGFQANAMVAWRVPEDRIEAVGEKLAAFKEVSHCYWRKPGGDWPYNLYTMIHAADEAACHDIARQMARKTGISTYTLLFSRRELKKTSMQYFSFET